MADLTLRPDGDVQLDNIAITGAATASEAIDESPDSHDGDDTRIDRDALTADASATVELSTTPSDFKQMDSLTARAAVRTSGVQADDTLVLHAQVLTAAGDPLTGEIVVATSNALGLSYAIAEVDFTGLRSSSGKTDWDRARLKLRWDYTAAGTDDLFDLRLSAFETSGTYTPRDMGPPIRVFTRLPTTQTRRGHAQSTVPAPTASVSDLTLWREAVTTLTPSSTATFGRVIGTRRGSAASSHTAESETSHPAVFHAVRTSRRPSRAVTHRRLHTAESAARIAGGEDDLLLLLTQLDH